MKKTVIAVPKKLYHLLSNRYPYHTTHRLYNTQNGH